MHQSQVDARSLKPMHVRAFSKDNIFCEYSPDYSTFTIVLIVMYFESKTESKYCYSYYLFFSVGLDISNILVLSYF